MSRTSGNILQSVSRIAKGSKLAPHHGVRNREGIASQEVDVLENERGKPRDVLRLDGIRAEPWADTTTHAGKMIMTVFAGIAEFERDLIRERTGVARGRQGGSRHRKDVQRTRGHDLPFGSFVSHLGTGMPKRSQGRRSGWWCRSFT